MTASVVGENTAPASVEHERGSDRLVPWTLAAALLLHGLVFALIAVDWEAMLAGVKSEPTPIPVALVIVPPPAPAPPQTAQPTQPAVQPRSSGPDQKTEAKATEEPKPALPQSTPEAQPTDPKEAKETVQPRTADKMPATAPRLTQLGEQAVVAPEVHHEAQSAPLVRHIHWSTARGGTGSRDTEGDAYLNRMHDIVESNRIYPPAQYFAGDAERLAVYSMVVDPSGQLVTITLLSSTGSSALDEAAGRMLRASAPFPPFPSSYPQIRTVIVVDLPIYPNPR
jgi:TonB family protein